MPTAPASPLSPLQLDAASGLSWRQLDRPVAAPPQALLVLLHGVGGNELQLAALAQQQDARLRVVLARGPLAFGPSQFGWFQVAFGPQGPRIDPAQAEDSRVRLLQLLAALQADSGIVPARTVAAGFSQGGIMSAGLALTDPARLGGFGLLSGRILPEIAPQVAAPAELQHTAGFVAHGEYDDKLPVAWAHKADAWLTELGVAHQTRLYPAGHELTPQMAADFQAWLAARLWPTA